MLLENYELGVEPRTLQLLFGLGIGLVFGVAAQISKFCLRRAVASDQGPDRSALAVWMTAFAFAIGGFFVAESFQVVDVSEHRFLSTSIPVTAIVLGGLAFGVGMVLTRGCISRLTVLTATGNLRALVVIAIFAITAHATLKGVFAPVRVAMGSVQIDLPIASLAEVPLFAPVASALLIVTALILARSTKTSIVSMLLGAAIGLTAVFGWVTTSYLLFDEFDPLPFQSAAFTLPWSDTLFWVLASSSIPAGFGVGLVGGVLAGSFLSASVRGELKLQSFEAPSDMLRYGLGGVLMGFGGVLAGGCTVGAGLSGSATLSVGALLALASIIVGGIAARQVLARTANHSFV